MEVFQEYAYYYNAFYKDKDYKAEAKQIDLLLNKYGNNVKHIINFGCGTGKHDIELMGMGYQCTGIDMSRKMIDIAKENAAEAGQDITFLVSDIRQYKPDNIQYDAVISLFHVISYQNTNEDVLAVLRSARAALNVGGIFLFDVWYGPGVLSDKPVVRVKKIQDEKYKLIRIANPIMHDKSNVVDVCYEILVINQESGETQVIKEVHNMRYFFWPELKLYLEIAGFELIENLDCGTLEETGYHSWTSYFIARAV